jgi:peptidoglycan/LPS O-acetylase OafA/YrhL
LAWLLALPLIRYLVLRGVHDPGAIHTAIYYPFHTHSDGLAVGLLISWMITWKPQPLRIGRWLDVVLALVFLVGFCLWYFAPPTFLFSVVAITYGALMFLLLRIRPPRLFRLNIFHIIARLSFGVYLLHAGLLDRVMPFHTRVFGEGFPSFLCAFILWGSVSLALAFVTFSVIELPFLKLRDRSLAKKPVDIPGRERTVTVTS